MPTERKLGTVDRAKLASIIRKYFEALCEAGCRWDVLTRCVTCFAFYNKFEVPQPVKYDSEGEIESQPIRVMKSVRKPPNSQERTEIKKHVDAILEYTRRHEQLLLELGALAPPDIPEFEEFSAWQSLWYLPRILRWVRKILADNTYGNFRTVAEAGAFPLCVYVEWIASTKKSELRPLLGHVAELLHQVSGDPKSPWCKSGCLREIIEESTAVVPTMRAWRWGSASNGRSKRGCGLHTRIWHRRPGIRSTSG